MIKKIFDYLEGVKEADSLADRVLGIMVPGARVTNQERSDDPCSPWIDTEFKFLGEVFTLRFVLVDGKHIMELIHNGNCMDIPDNASLPQFIIENFFYRFRERIETAIGNMFTINDMRVEDPNGTEIEIHGELVSSKGNKHGVVFYAHVDDETLGCQVYKDGEMVAESNLLKIDGTANSENELRNCVKNCLEIQDVGIKVCRTPSHVSKELYDKICKTIEGSPIMEIQTHCSREELLENNPGIEKLRDIEEAGGYAVFDILGTDGQVVQLPYSGESDLAALQTGIRGIFAYSQQMNNAAYCVMHDLGIEK